MLNNFPVEWNKFELINFEPDLIDEYESGKQKQIEEGKKTTYL
jgi:hypothetical protein